MRWAELLRCAARATSSARGSRSPHPTRAVEPLCARPSFGPPAPLDPDAFPVAPAGSRSLRPLPASLGEGCEPWAHRPGAVDWLVPDPGFDASRPTMYAAYAEVPEPVRRKGSCRLTPSLFPPGKQQPGEAAGEAAGEEAAEGGEAAADDARAADGEGVGDQEAGGGKEAATICDAWVRQQLRHCGRLLPQHLDSGGFFVAVIERQQRQQAEQAAEQAQAKPQPLQPPPPPPQSAKAKVPWQGKRLASAFSPYHQDPPEAVVGEFLRFYGLHCTEEAAAAAGVSRFPAEALACTITSGLSRRSKGGGSSEWRAGDWACPGCGANVFKTNDACFKCGSARPAGSEAAAAAEVQARVAALPTRRGQLSLVSAGLKRLYVGGARFSPMESGIGPWLPQGGATGRGRAGGGGKGGGMGGGERWQQ